MTFEDRIRIRHMLDAIKEALAFMIDKSREDLDSNRMLALAIIKELEIIGKPHRSLHSSLKPGNRTFHGQISSECVTV